MPIIGSLSQRKILQMWNIIKLKKDYKNMEWTLLKQQKELRSSKRILVMYINPKRNIKAI
jgi:hypothetical protein